MQYGKYCIIVNTLTELLLTGKLWKKKLLTRKNI